MALGKSLAGILQVELTSAEPELSLYSLNEAGIKLGQIQKSGELVYTFCIHRSNIDKLEELCKKRGENIKIIRRNGFFQTVKRFSKRPMMLTGIFLLLLFTVILPTRVLFVQIKGNIHVPSKKILSAAEACGINFGASRRGVRSEKVKNTLLSMVPQLQWAGVNTYGCVAVIQVRERTETESTDEENLISNIVADRDGYILSGTVTRGTGLFTQGQAVKAGQVLISGYTDCGLCIQATRADGEVLAQTNRTLGAITPSAVTLKTDIKDVKRKYSLIFRKKRINLWKDSGISDSSCGRMYEEYYVTLPGGFQLPIALSIEEYIFYGTKNFEIAKQEAEQVLTCFAEHYLLQQMIAGNIQNRVQLVSKENGKYCLLGKYVCTEMIGRVQREQIGDTNGKVS